MLKHKEPVEVGDAEKLTLNARHVFDALKHNSNGVGMAIPHNCFTIRLTAHNSSHAGNECLARSI